MDASSKLPKNYLLWHRIFHNGSNFSVSQFLCAVSVHSAHKTRFTFLSFFCGKSPLNPAQSSVHLIRACNPAGLTRTTSVRIIVLMLVMLSVKGACTGGHSSSFMQKALQCTVVLKCTVVLHTDMLQICRTLASKF